MISVTSLFPMHLPGQRRSGDFGVKRREGTECDDFTGFDTSNPGMAVQREESFG